MKQLIVIYLSLLLVSNHVFAEGHKPESIKVGYFLHWPTPSQFSQLKKTYDSALGVRVDWVAFDSGIKMNQAMASGELQIAYSHGLVPFIAGVSSGQDLTVIGIAVAYPDSDNCIVRSDSGIDRNSASRLVGKRVVTRFGGVTHFRMLRLLEHLGVDPAQVDIQPVHNGVEAVMALRDGEALMACGYGNTLRELAKTGQPLLSGEEQAAIGLKLFDVVTVPTAFMNEHPDLVQAFMDVTEATNAQWRQNPDPMRASIARAADMNPMSATTVMQGFEFPSAEEQRSPAWLGEAVAEYARELAEFYVQQGGLPQALDDYAPYITTRFLR